MKKETAPEVFRRGGWTAVWDSLSNKGIRPEEAACLAEEMAKQLEGRPPLDPFWLEGAATLKKTNVSESVRAKTFLCWLNEADTKEGWDAERLTFEVLYLMNTQFLSWGIETDWRNGSKTLAEATLFEIPREEVFDWKWDWKQIRKDWWASSLEHHPARMEKAIAKLDKTREQWGAKEVELAETALEVWANHPKTREKSALASAAISRSKMAEWEKTVLNYHHQTNDPKQTRMAL
jgi:hypothetical protein